MRTALLQPSVDREAALNALMEIRAGYSDLQTFVTGAFDRLDGLAAELRAQKTVCEQTRRQAEQEALQDQIDQLARLTTELTESVAEHKRLTASRKGAQPQKAET